MKITRKNDQAFVDTLFFTFCKQDLIGAHQQKPRQSDIDLIKDLHYLLMDVFGFGVAVQEVSNSNRCYRYSYPLGPAQHKYGRLHIGSQADTILLELYGVGCSAAKTGWERRLYDWLTGLNQVKITRCDVAHDFFDGQYTPEQAYADYRHCLYCNGKQPKCEKRGTAWEHEDGSGKTLYIGSRYGAKLARIYEKGRQLGDKASRWVRFEVEFRANDYEIPADILIYPGEYLCGAYPVGARLFKNSAKRKTTKQVRKALTVQRAAYFARLQAGAFVRYQHDLGRTDGEERLFGC